jgi:hypothetical protein
MSRYTSVRRVFEEVCTAKGPQEGARFFAEQFRRDLGLSVNELGSPVLDTSKAKMSATEWSLRGLAESLCGHEWADNLGRGAAQGQQIFEAGGIASMVPGQLANVSAFLGSVTGLLDVAVLEQYQKPEYIIDSLVEVRPSKVRQRKLIGTGRIGNQSRRRNPGDPYPMASFGERYQLGPETQQDALGMSVTFEAVFFDQTREVMDQAGKVGDELGLKKELDGFTVIAGITNPYNYKGVAYNTYLTVGNWVNDGTNVLVDYANVNVVEGLFSRMTDQETGLRINADYDTVIVAPTKTNTAMAIVNATQVRTGSDSGGTNYTQTYTPGSRVQRSFSITSSRYLDMLLTNSATDVNAPGLALTQANADKYWWALKTGKGGAFFREENWPLQVQQAAPNDFNMLNHKLLLSVFADQMHAFGVNDPRLVVRGTN